MGRKYSFSLAIGDVDKTINAFSNAPDGVNPSESKRLVDGNVDHCGLISDKLVDDVASLEPAIQPSSTSCCSIPANDAAIGVDMLVPEEARKSLLYESNKPSALAD